MLSQKGLTKEKRKKHGLSKGKTEKKRRQQKRLIENVLEKRALPGQKGAQHHTICFWGFF